MRTRHKEHGFTLVETVVALGVMSLGLIAALKILESGTASSESSTSLLMNEERARGALTGIFDVMTESAIKNLDTTMRVHSTPTTNDIASDRFTISGVTLRQCTSPTCEFHTRPDLSTRAERRNCAFEFCSGALGSPVTRGKIFPATINACPFDGSGLSSTARLDGVKFFTARDESGAFTTLGDGTPRWGGLVLIFPCATTDGLCELRRYDVYVSDLLATAPTASAGWSRFPKLSPSMIDLFDFGTDGTTNGTPDGKVPITNATSDARTESFTTGTYQGSPVILITKTLTTSPLPTYPSRTLTLRINLETGQTYFAVDHHDSLLSYWTDSRTFTRSPRTLMRGMTEFACSTQVSNPYNAATNPSGVSEGNVVRITVGTSDAPKTAANQWMHHVDAFQIKARN